jgi:hypothetical protein
MKNKVAFPVTTTIPNTGLSPALEISCLDATKQNFPAMLKALLIDPYGTPGRALEGLLGTVAEVLRTQGVGQENIRVALIIFSVICSAQAGIPLAIVLRVDEEKAVAEDLVTACLKLAPESLFVELKSLTIDDLYSAKDHFRNKVLVCRDFKGLKKVESDLKNLIINGSTSIQVSARSKYGSHMIESQVNGPVSFIGIETEGEPHMFDHPAIIRLGVADLNLGQEGNDGEVRKIHGIGMEMARIAQYVSRFSQKNVAFFQKDEFLSFVRNQRPIHHIYKSRFTIRFLKIFTIINNPGPPDFHNFIANLLNGNPENVKEWMKEIGWQKNGQTPANEDLVVSKVEYFMLAKLLNGLLPIKHTVPSLLRRQLFEVVKAINMGLLVKAFIPENDYLLQLYTLANNETYWARIKDIYLNFNKNRAEILSEINIEKELVALRKINAIERKKFRDNDGYGYYVADISIEKGIDFPKIYKLFGHCDEEHLLEAVDPVTGIVELI